MKQKIILVCLIGLVAGIMLAETKYASSGTSTSRVNFAAKNTPHVVKFIAATTGQGSKTIDVFARSGSPEAVSSAGTTNIQVVNPAVVITNSDLLIYQYANGTVAYGTCTIASTTNVIISPALSGTTSANDKLYEVSQIGSISVGNATNDTGVFYFSQAGDQLIETPSDSPLSVLVNGTNTVLNVTVQP